MYEKIIKRSILITLALLFIIPLAIQAQSAAPFAPERGPLYEKGSITMSLWKFQDNAGNVIERRFDSSRNQWVRVVTKNERFRISWAADGILPGTDGERSGNGIKCLNNWDDSLAASGQVDGTLSRSRVFRIVCAGMLGGFTINAPVVVGAPDLSVVSAQLTGLKPWGITGGTIPNTYVSAPYKVNVTVTNSGDVPVSSPFTIMYYASEDSKVESNNARGWKEFIVDNGIKAGETKTIEIYFEGPSSQYEQANDPASAKPQYHKVCLDARNVVAEENSAGTGETNNCKILDGFYKYVKPNAQNPA